MKIKRNGGFSLIEMIVSVAILGIVAAAAVGFMVSGANSFSSVSGNVNLQVRSQLAMNNIQEKLVDCNYGIYFDDGLDTLYIVNFDPSGSVYTADIYQFRDGAIYYGNHTCSLSAGTLTCSSAAPDLLAKGVSSFSADLSRYTDIDMKMRVTGVALSIGFQERSRSFLGS
jgi:prepilin-type N-terminal cleavage/methylation domain-containing protein